jgi:hypothetical protein
MRAFIFHIIFDLDALSRRTPVKIDLWYLFPVYVRVGDFQLPAGLTGLCGTSSTQYPIFSNSAFRYLLRLASTRLFK